MEMYKEKIKAAQDFEELCNIVEDAADDEWITNEDYCALYNAAVNRAQTMGGM